MALSGNLPRLPHRCFFFFVNLLDTRSLQQCPKWIWDHLPPWVSSSNLFQSFTLCQASASKTSKSRAGFTVLCLLLSHSVLRKWVQKAQLPGQKKMSQGTKNYRKKKNLSVPQNIVSKTPIKLLWEMLSFIYKYNYTDPLCTGYKCRVFLIVGTDSFYFIRGFSQCTLRLAHVLARWPPWIGVGGRGRGHATGQISPSSRRHRNGLSLWPEGVFFNTVTSVNKTQGPFLFRSSDTTYKTACSCY